MKSESCLKTIGLVGNPGHLDVVRDPRVCVDPGAGGGGEGEGAGDGQRQQLVGRR